MEHYMVRWKRLVSIVAMSLVALSAQAADKTFNLGTLTGKTSRSETIGGVWISDTHEYSFKVSKSGDCQFTLSEDSGAFWQQASWLIGTIYRVNGSQRQNLSVGSKLGQCQAGSSRTITLYCEAGVTYLFLVTASDSNAHFPYTITITPSSGGGSGPDPTPTPTPTPTTKPDLKFYKPDGWGAAVVVAKSSSATTSATSFKDNDTIYVRFAAVCRNAAITKSFKTVLYVDGVETKSWNTSSLKKDNYAYLEKGASIGNLSVGTHKLRFVVDGEYDVAESDESNNVYEKTITVESSVLTLKTNGSKYGTASASGTIAWGKTVTLTASAKSGYVFTGWFTDKDFKKALNPADYDNRSPTVRYTLPYRNMTVYARFNSKATVKSSLKFKDQAKKYATTAKVYTTSSSVNFPMPFTSRAIATATMSPYIYGLEIDSKTGRITGTPHDPGKHTVTVTVTDAAGNKIVQKVKINVKAPSWAYGNFNGWALVEGTPASMKFTSTAYGDVSGKVVLKGKSYPFECDYSIYNSDLGGMFPSISLTSSAYLPTMPIVQRSSGLTYTESFANEEGFAARLQKVVPLVQAGKSLKGMIGKSYTFKPGYKGSGISKSGDKLVVKFCDKDMAKVSGIINGKTFTGLSVGLMACGKSKTSTTTKYKLNVPVVEGTVKYYRLLTFKVTIDTKTKKVKKVEKSFSKFE